MVPGRRPGLLHRARFHRHIEHLPRLLGRLRAQTLRPRHRFRYRPVTLTACYTYGRYWPIRAACPSVQGRFNRCGRYTLRMGTPASPIEPRQVGILILDDDAQSQGALKQILDSEGWRVRMVPDTKAFLAELRTGEWSLVIANVTITGTESPLFVTLRELTNVPAEEGGRLRALYMVPEVNGEQYVEPLEHARLPYVLRPFHLHDFLEKVSDLLVEVKAIEGPLRMTRYEFGAARKKKKAATKTNSMFASRESYSYTEEELAEYEKHEAETSSLARKNKSRNN